MSDTYSERLLEEYPMLDRANVIKLLREHDCDILELDRDFRAEDSEHEGIEYASVCVMAWLGY